MMSQNQSYHPLRFRAAAAVCAVVLILAGCRDDPDSVGGGLIPPSDFLPIDSLTVTANSSRNGSALPPFLFSDRLLLGKEDANEAWLLIRFAQFPTVLKDATVLSATLRLKTLYKFRDDTTASLSFLIHKGIQAWDGDSLTFDSLLTGQYHEVGTTPPVTIGPVAKDSVIEITVDPALVEEWFRSVDDVVPTTYGLVLEPINTNLILGFGSFNAAEGNRPEMTLRYRGEGLTTVDSTSLTTGLDRFVARTTDLSWQNDPLRIYARNGISYRGIVTFNISTIPHDAVIHRAILEVTASPLDSRLNSYSTDSLVAVFMDDQGYVNSIIALNESVTQIQGNTLHSFPMYDFVQRWVRGVGIPSVAIAGIDESRAIDSFAIYGVASDSLTRPKLIVIYSPAQ